MGVKVDVASKGSKASVPEHGWQQHLWEFKKEGEISNKQEKGPRSYIDQEALVWREGSKVCEVIRLEEGWHMEEGGDCGARIFELMGWYEQWSGWERLEQTGTRQKRRTWSFLWRRRRQPKRWESRDYRIDSKEQRSLECYEGDVKWFKAGILGLCFAEAL